jgi:ATPase family associated with various cellular activities (AAA)
MTDCCRLPDFSGWVILDRKICLRAFKSPGASQLPAWVYDYVYPNPHTDHVTDLPASSIEVVIEAPADVFALYTFQDIVAEHVVTLAKKAILVAKVIGLNSVLVATSVKSEVFVFKVSEGVTTEFIIAPPSLATTLDLEISCKSTIVRGYLNSSPPIFPCFSDRRVVCYHALDFTLVKRLSRKFEILLTNARADVLVIWGITPATASVIASEVVPRCRAWLVLVAGKSTLGLPDSLPVVSLQSEIATVVQAEVTECPEGLRLALYQLEELLIHPMRHPELFDKFGVRVSPRVLIYGEGGKAELVRQVIAKMGSRPVVQVHVSQLFGKYLGSTERRIQKVFETASSQSPCLLVMHDIHLLVGLRGDDDEGLSGTFNRALAALLTGLDGVDANHTVAILATSALPPEQLEPAIVRPGRLESWLSIH